MWAQKTQRVETVPRRKSRRIQGLEPQIDGPPPKAVYIPPELKVAVLAQLDKRNLKNVRLVSKDWNTLATRLLFDRVYISCRAKDLEVFENITSHPVISTSVRELVYDGSLFQKEMTISVYFRHLYRSLISIKMGHKSEPFKSANREINAFIRDYKNRTITYIYDRHIQDNFIVEGHKNYKHYAEVERRGLGNGLFLSRLCRGLRRQDRLRSVILSSNLWTYDLCENKRTGSVKPNTLHGPESGSPLVRSWNPLHLRPFLWTCDEMKSERPLVRDHFYIVTAAISKTHRNLKSLEIPYGEVGSLPPQTFNRPAMTDDHFAQTLNAYSGLEVLNISIDANEDEDSDDVEALAALPRMLEQMRGLKTLELNLSKDVDRHPSRANTTEHYTYQQVFPTLALWPRLTKLSLMGIAIGGHDLLCLVGARAKVTDLTLYCIELLDGTWEGLIEGLSHISRMTELFMIGSFKHRGGQIFAPHKTISGKSDSQTLRAIEYYVMFGSRHPCLAPDDDSESAHWWYLDMSSDDHLKLLKTLSFEMPTVKRPADVEVSQKLHDSTVPS